MKRDESDRRLFFMCAALALINVLITHWGPWQTWGLSARNKPTHPPGEELPPVHINYRNYFEEIGISSGQIHDKISALVNTFFQGNESERLYFEDKKDMAYMVDFGKDAVHSEGMSYGLMIAVQLDRKEEFDKM